MSTLFQPFADFDLLRREIDRTLESFRLPGVVRNAFLPARNPRSFPLVNIAEDADGYRVEALAPGVNPDSLQINVLRDQLTISGEKPALAEDGIRSEDYHRSERAAGRFTRTFTLPAAVDESKVSAEYKAGILKIALPKSESAKPRRIAVSMS